MGSNSITTPPAFLMQLQSRFIRAYSKQFESTSRSPKLQTPKVQLQNKTKKKKRNEKNPTEI